MSDDKALVPTEQKTVEFYDDEIVAIRAKNGTVYIPIRPICVMLDINFDAQRRRINRDPVLTEEVMSVVVTTTDIDPNSRRPHTSEMLALPLDYLSGFLFGINASRVKEDVRSRLVRYQRECYKVLNEAFQEGRLTADRSFSELIESESPAAQAYKMARAMMELARNQLLLETQMESHNVRLNAYERRLEDVEVTLGNTDRHVSPDQASQISQAVKAVAMKLSKASGRNEYGGV